MFLATRKRWYQGVSRTQCMSTLFTRGVGLYGALGQGDSLMDSPTYQEVSLLSHCEEQNTMVKNAPVKVSAGWGHSAVVTDKGKLFIFGRNQDFAILNRLGTIAMVSKTLARFMARTTNSDFFTKNKLLGDITLSQMGYYSTPYEIEGFDKVTDVSCSAGWTVFVSDGNVYSFGINKYTQCGIRDKKFEFHVFDPVHISSIPGKCVAVSAGLQHGLALTEEGIIYAWGKNHRGELGIGRFQPVYIAGVLPERVTLGAESRLATQIVAGFGHSAALAEDGAVYVWGRCMSDELAKDGKTAVKYADHQLTPRRIELPNGRKAVSIASSNFHVVIIASDRSLWMMGMEEHSKTSVMHPVQVQSDFHHESGERIAQQQLDSEAESEEAVVRNINVVLPPNAVLKNDHDRVVVIYPDEKRQWKNNSSNSSVGISQGVYEIVLHQGEAYYKEVDLVSHFDSGLSDVKVVDYSRGWKHQLIVADITTSN